MRKLGVQEQEFRYPQRANLGGVRLAIGFESDATAEKADPLEVFRRFDGTFKIVGHALEMGLEQRGERIRALDITAQLNELPALAVAHGGVGDAVEEISAFENR